MRSHSEIIADAGGPAQFHAQLGLAEREIHAVRSWNQRNSIPSEHWKGVNDAGLASLDELAEAAARRREASASEAA